MNISTWPKGKKILVVLLAIFFFVGIGITVYLVQKQQETRTHAEKATVISLTPPNQSAAAGDQASVGVSLNPGTNQVNFVKLSLKYDPDVFDSEAIEYIANQNSPLQMVGSPTISDGEAIVTLQVGADPTKVVQVTTTLGTFNLPVKSDATPGDTDLTIDQGSSQVRSVGGKDAFNENVLQSVVNAKVTITGGQCIPNQSTCSWDKSENAASYHYRVIEKAPDSDVLAPVAEDDTTDTSVKFTSKPGYTYTCFVKANNECGTSDESSSSSTCNVTPTPTLSVTPTLTPTPTITLTPTPGLTSTPTPTIPQIVTPTTPQTFVTATPGPTVVVQGPTSAPQPTLPPTGNPVVMGGIVGGLLFVLGGLALLFL